MNDVINNPKHYTNHPSGIECIQITEHMGFAWVMQSNIFGEQI